MVAKKRVIKKYEQLDDELLQKVQAAYPYGFEDEFISFQNPKGELELALPLETEEVSYLIKMPKNSIPEMEESDVAISDDGPKFESLDAAENIADED